ncbi:MAG: Ig-like domain-containing protein, partial [Thermoplasmata archaeon]|nr:Ig-like domain-containing protein [Thermoplasmata archaeon]
EGPDSPYSAVVNHTWTVFFRGVSWTEYGSFLEIYREAPGILSVILEVSDFCGNFDTISLDIEIIDDILPILDPMKDMMVDEDVTITLTPEGYSDNDPDLYRSGVFTWTFSGPRNHSMTGESVQLSFSVPGIYDVRVELTDGSGNSAASGFNITVRDTTSPVIGHLGDLFVIKGSTALLDGSAIEDNDPLFPIGANFSWTFTDLGTRYYGDSVEYITDTLGQFKVTIAVRDGGGNKVYGAFILHVINDGTPPGAIGSNPQDGATNVSLRPMMTISFDEDMDPASYVGGISISDQFSEDVSFDVDLTGEDRRAIVIEVQLDPGKGYTVKLSNSILDVTGTPLVPWSFSFSTISRMEVLAVNGGSFDRNDPILFILAGDLIDLTFTDDIDSDSTIVYIGPGEVTGTFEYVIDEEGATMGIRIPEDLPEGRYELLLGNVSSLHRSLSDADVVILFDVGWRPDEAGDEGGTSFGLFALLAIVALIVVSLIIIVMVSKRRSGTDATQEAHRGPPLEPEHILDHEHHHLHPGHHQDGGPGPGAEDENNSRTM